MRKQKEQLYVVTCRARHPAAGEKPGYVTVRATSKADACRQARAYWDHSGASISDNGGSVVSAVLKEGE